MAGNIAAAPDAAAAEGNKEAATAGHVLLRLVILRRLGSLLVIGLAGLRRRLILLRRLLIVRRRLLTGSLERNILLPWRRWVRGRWRPAFSDLAFTIRTLVVGRRYFAPALRADPREHVLASISNVPLQRIPTKECRRPAASLSRRNEWNSSGRHMVHKFDA